MSIPDRGRWLKRDTSSIESSPFEAYTWHDGGCMRDWGILLLCLAGLWALAVLACCTGEGGPTPWQIMARDPGRQGGVHDRIRQEYPWVDLTVRLRYLALGSLILGLALYAMAW